MPDNTVDADIAELLSFNRGAWQNQASAVVPAQVAHVRADLLHKAPTTRHNRRRR